MRTLEGYVDDGHAAPLAGVPAVVTVVGSGTVVASTATDSDGHWYFDALPEGQEYFVNVTDIDGNAVVRGPWSGEVRDVWVRDRLSLSGTGVADLPGASRTLVAGLPLVLDPNPGNGLVWSATGLFSASGGLTQAAADLRYEPLDSAWTKAEADARYAELTDVDPFPQYLTPTEANALYAPVGSGGITQAAADLRYEPIDTMYTKAESDARYPQKTDVDPYPNYLTSTEADALFLTPAEGNAAYATTAHTHDTTYVQLTGGSVMTGLLGPSTHNTRDLGTTGTRWRALYGMTGDFTTSLTVATKPLVISPDAANIVEWRANGFYAAAGAVSDVWVNTTGDTMTGDLNMTANVLPTVTNVRSLGSTSLRWLKVWATDADFTNAPTVGGAALLTSTTADALFLTPAEGNAAYATAAHNHDATYVKLAGGSVMTGLLGPTTTNVNDLGTTALRWRKLWAVDGEFTNAPTVGGVAVLTATSAGLLYEPLDSAYTKSEDDARFVNLAGGSVMTGLLGPTTTNTRDLGTTTLRWRKLWGVDADLSGTLTVGTGPLTVSAGGIAVTGASTFSVAPTVGGSALLTATAGDTAYVNVGGDTMTGALNVNLSTGTVVQTLRNGNADDNVQLRFKGNVTAVDQWAIGNNITGGTGRNFDIYDLVSGASRFRITGTTGVVDHPTGLSINSRAVIMAGCRVYHSVAQSIATSTATVLAFNSERWDTDAFHDTVTNNSRLTVPTGLGGTYHIWGNIGFAPNGTGIREMTILLNGTTAIADVNQQAIAGGSYTFMPTFSTIHQLAAGDYVQLRVFQSSGAAVDVATIGNYTPEFAMQRIG